LIEIAFVRFKSTAENPGPPTIYLAGGPGGSGIDTAKGPDAFPLLMALREIGDVILLDQRGIGISKPSLACSKAWNFPLDQQGAPKTMLRFAKIRISECVHQLKDSGIDLNGYNTNESADDVQAVTKAIGAAKVNLAWDLARYRGEQKRVELLASALRSGLPAKRKYLPFESCSHRRNIRVFRFLPIPYHRIAVASWFFCPRIGHLELGPSKPV
jgi:hypothetical protein